MSSLGSNDSNNSTVPCKKCGKVELEGDDVDSDVYWVACDRCGLWEHQVCAGIKTPRKRTSKYCCVTCKKPQWTPSDSKKMWDYIEKTGDVVIGTDDHSAWFKNMMKEIGGPYADTTFRRHLNEEMTKYVSNGTNDLKQRIKYAILSKITCSPEVVVEFQKHGDVAFNKKKKQVLAFTERGSTEPLFAVKNWKKKSSTVDPTRQNLPGPIPQSDKDRLLELVGVAIQRQAEEKKKEGKEVEEEDEEEEEEQILQSEGFVSNFFNDALALASSNEVNDAAPTSPDRRSVSPRATDRSPLRELSVDLQVDDFVINTNISEVERNNMELSNNATNMSTEQQVPVATTGGTAIVHRGQELDTSIFQEVPQVTSQFGAKRGCHIKTEGEPIPAKRARADALKQSHLAPLRPCSPPPETTVGNYLNDLISFLRKLNRQNEKLKEFIAVMENIEMSYSDILSSLRRLFKSVKNNAVIEEMDTEDINCCYDKTYYFGLKNFLVLFKKFVSNFEEMLDGFGQFEKDIKDEIQRCEEEEKGGKQKLLQIEEIIDRVSSDFDQFGLMKEYKAEVEKRRSANGSCSSNSH